MLLFFSSHFLGLKRPKDDLSMHDTDIRTVVSLLLILAISLLLRLLRGVKEKRPAAGILRLVRQRAQRIYRRKASDRFWR